MIPDHFPRARLAHTPTPLEEMPNLSRALGGPRLFVKRDDCTGLAMGGNKARQLEYYFGQALAEGADTVITTGAVQSNHLRLTAAAARKLGLACEVQLEDRVKGMDQAYATSGNVLLDRLLGATIHAYPEGEDEAGADKALRQIAEDVREKGGKPYLIPLGPEHPPLGALGYVEAAGEILGQAAEQGFTVDAMVVPSGSAATHAGLLAGFRAQNEPVRVFGVCVRRDAGAQAARALQRASETAEMLGLPGIVGEQDIWVTDDYLGPGYGRLTEAAREAMGLAARHEGLLLDPVYTAKSMAALIGLVRSGVLEPSWNVVFLHTGGTPALFGYTGQLNTG